MSQDLSTVFDLKFDFQSIKLNKNQVEQIVNSLNLSKKDNKDDNECKLNSHVEIYAIQENVGYSNFFN